MLTVGVVTYNNEKTIIKTLQSLEKQRIKFNLVIVDNSSQDNTLKLISEKFPQSKIIKNQKNNGFTRGNNQIIDYFLSQNSNYLLLLNPDCVLMNSAVYFLQKASKLYKNVGIFGPKIYSDRKTIWSMGGKLDTKRQSADLIDFGKKDTKITQVTKCEFISGTCLFLPKEVLKSGLRFYEPYFMYYEDVEFCLKARKDGFLSFVVPQAESIHLETSKGKQFSPIKSYYLARNHLLFVERNAPFALQLREFLRLPKTLYEAYRLGETFAILGIRDYFLRRFGKL